MLENYIKPLKIGNVEVENNVFLAPMAGVTDIPFRKICRKFNPGLTFTEMASTKAMEFNSDKTEKILHVMEDERPSVVQIFGSDKDVIRNTIEKLNQDDTIDIISRISSTMYSLKIYIADYITNVFAAKSYIENDIAIIYKKPTPILVCNVDYKKNKILEGYYKTPSTLDYNGIYKGKYIDFDAKETLNKTSFPLANLHKHQLEHMKKVINHGGISFLIVKINNLYYLLDGLKIIDFINSNNRKSIPYNYIKNYGLEIKEGINPALDYIKVIDNYYFKEEV